MAVLLTESRFTDIYNNVTKVFKANAGDKINIKHTFETSISFVSSQQNQFSIDNLEKKVTRGQGSFLTDGFRVGQNYSLRFINSANNVHDTWFGVILSVTDLEMTMTGLPNQNFVSTGSTYIAVLLSTADYDSLDFGFNFIDNAVPKEATPSLESYIDQEVSRFSVDGISSLSVGSSLNLVQVGKRSGQFSISSATIKRLADVSNPFTAFASTRKSYELSIDILFSGMFSDGSFVGDKCLKYYSKSSFKVVSAESLAPTTITYLENANTGLWNEGFNSDQANSTYSSIISQIVFNKDNTYQLIAKCPTSLGIGQVELGAMYYTLEDDFNKNKQESQDYYLPFLKTGLISNAEIGNDWNSTTAYPFNILLEDYNYVDAGGVRTFTITITFSPYYSNPNGFGKFVENRGDLDRAFLLWLKIGNTNRLFFDGQLTFEEPIGIPFDPDNDRLKNHDNNIDYKVIANVNNVGNDDFNIEDDIAYVAEFNLIKFDDNQSVTAKVVVKDSTTDFEFTLDKVTFDLQGVDLQYFINQYVPVPNNLPSSSVKKEAFLIEKVPLQGAGMVVRLYYPFIVDWRYWEEVLSTHPYFVSQNINNSNWYNYKVLPWELFVKVEIKRNGVVDYHYRNLPFKNYDDWGGTSTIQLYDPTETTLYSSLQENTTMLIKATHKFQANYSGFPWGMITIEPKESSPRYILSTEIDRTQTENPLVGIANDKRCDIQFLSSDTIVLRCYVNTNLLVGNNFCISSKISEDGQQNINPPTNKLLENGLDKITEDALNVKIIE